MTPSVSVLKSDCYLEALERVGLLCSGGGTPQVQLHGDMKGAGMGWAYGVTFNLILPSRQPPPPLACLTEAWIFMVKILSSDTELLV